MQAISAPALHNEQSAFICHPMFSFQNWGTFCGLVPVTSEIIFLHREIKKTYVRILTLPGTIRSCAATESSPTSPQKQ
jgi:hypothetical protein